MIRDRGFAGALESKDEDGSALLLRRVQIGGARDAVVADVINHLGVTVLDNGDCGEPLSERHVGLVPRGASWLVHPLEADREDWLVAILGDFLPEGLYCDGIGHEQVGLEDGVPEESFVLGHSGEHGLAPMDELLGEHIENIPWVPCGPDEVHHLRGELERQHELGLGLEKVFGGLDGLDDELPELHVEQVVDVVEEDLEVGQPGEELLEIGVGHAGRLAVQRVEALVHTANLDTDSIVNGDPQ
mmetsp:Transcript_13439/g.35753  ORF Transcript_13439/g.35753 Transcript_13439/m.35753 type:complete len:244 (+) Transcript_13439:554-1285(+)